MANNTNTNTTKKAYNPTVTALFEDSRFGEGALVSAPLNAEGFSNLQKHGELGVKFVIRKGKQPNKNGGSTFFMEILPALTNDNNKYAKRNTANDDGI